MNIVSLLERIKQKPLLSDGAMGTLLHSRGVGYNQCFDELNLSNPGLIEELHKEYIFAGADIIETNTFGANRFKLTKHGLENSLVQINQAGVKIARSAIEATGNRDVLIAGDVGPLGVRIAPYGRVQPEQARQAFFEQLAVLYDAGIDLILLETISDINEMVEAILAAQDLNKRKETPLLICSSLTFTKDDRTLLGDEPAAVAVRMAKAGADVIGVNCSGGPAQLLRLLKTMHLAVPVVPLLVQPNAGWPEQVGDRIMYPADAEYFGQYAQAFCEAGASIIGGCCGTTPSHTQAMRKALDENPQGCGSMEAVISLPNEVTEQQTTITQSSRLANRLAQGKFSIAVEMDPPRGISTHKLVAGASLLAEAGADVINVADSPMARMRMSAWAVCDVIHHQVGIESTLHFPTRGRNILRVQGDLLAAHALGIRNVFVVMGDPTAIGDYPEAMDNYDLVPSGLIQLIKTGFNSGIDHAGNSIGQPTAFFVGSALNLNPKDVDKEIKNLHKKVMAGADFFLTQPVYLPETGLQLLDRYKQEYGEFARPIFAGILPLVSFKHATYLNNEVPGINIPGHLIERLSQAGENSPMTGVETAIELIQQLKGWVQGIYIMPQFHRYDLVAEIIEAVKE